MKRPRNSSTPTLPTQAFTIAKSISVASAAAERYRGGSKLAAMVAMLCAAPASPSVAAAAAAAAAAAIGAGSRGCRAAFLHSFPRAGAERLAPPDGARSAPRGEGASRPVCPRAGRRPGTTRTRHRHADVGVAGAYSGGGGGSDAFLAAASPAAAGARPFHRPACAAAGVSAMMPSRRPDLRMSYLFCSRSISGLGTGNGSALGSTGISNCGCGALSSSSNSSGDGSSKAFFGSGSSSRTAARRRRDRRQETRAMGKRNGGLDVRRPRAPEGAPAAGPGAGGEVSDETRAAGAEEGNGGQHNLNDVADEGQTVGAAAAGAAARGGGVVEGGADGAQEEEGEGEQQQQKLPAPPRELPFGTAYHIPVVCKEVLEWLVTDPDGVYVDCTLGGGGHSAALLSRLGPAGRVVGLDRDPEALREASTRLAAEAEAGRFEPIRSNFADLWSAVRSCRLLHPLTATGGASPSSPQAGAAAAAAAEAAEEAEAVSPAEGGLPPPIVASALAAAASAAPLVSTPPPAARSSPQAPAPVPPPLVDGILVDLGVSSHQIDDGARGFSFSADGPLDMRMEGGGEDVQGEGAGQVKSVPTEQGGGGHRGVGGDGGPLSAFDVVNFADEMDIREMVWRYGDEKRSTKIARAIVESRPISSTKELAEVVGRCAPPKERVKTLARVFQALRIEVNGELNALEALLEQAKHIVKPGGRLLILSYHSLEDRRVKRVFASGNLKGKVEKDFYGNVLSPWKPLLRKPLTAGDAEVALNPRARSVRLRVAERTEHA